LVTRSRELVSGRRNGCSTCIHGHLQEAKKVGETDEQRLSAIILMIATLNFFNRINVTVNGRASSPIPSADPWKGSSMTMPVTQSVIGKARLSAATDQGPERASPYSGAVLAG
jgi:AhpD family alkylhydroperoxidase